MGGEGLGPSTPDLPVERGQVRKDGGIEKHKPATEIYWADHGERSISR